MASRKAVVYITADTSGLERGASKASAEMRGLATHAERVGSGFSSSAKHMLAFGAALGGLGAGIGLAKNAISTTEGLAVATSKLHNASGLDIKTSSEWIALAQSRGVEAAKLSQSMAILAGHIHDAEGGSKKQQETFKTLGITQKDLQATGGDLNKTLLLMADKFHAMPPSVNKLSTAKALLGRQWQTLLPILNLGSGALQQQLQLADKYGVTLDAKTLPMLTKLAASQREMKIASLGLKVAFTEAVAPALEQVEQAGLKVVRIFEGPGSMEEKFKRAGNVISPLVNELQKGFEAALPQIANAVGAAAPKVAESFVNGFENANIWGQIAIGAFLLKKFGGFGAFAAMGRQAGGAFGGGFAQTEARAAGAGGAGGFLAGARNRFGRVLGVGSVAIPAGLIAGSAIGGTPGRAATGAGFGATAGAAFGPLGAGLGALAGAGIGASGFGTKGDGGAGSAAAAFLKTEKGIVDALAKGKVNADQAAAAMGRLGAQQRQLGFDQAGKKAQQFAQSIRVVQDDIGALKNGAAVSLTDLRNRFNQNMTDITALFQKHPKLWRHEMDMNMNAAFSNLRTLLNDGKDHTNTYLGQIKGIFSADFQATGRITKDNMDHVVAAIRQGMADGSINAKKGLQAIHDYSLTYLSTTFNIKGQDAEVVLKRTGGNLGGAVSASASGRGTNATGGWIGQRGQMGHDTVPIMAGAGEFVLNRHQQAPVETAMRTVYGMGLDELASRVTTPHYFASGGPISVTGTPFGVQGIDDITTLRGAAQVADARLAAAGSGQYVFPLPSFQHEERVDRGQDMQGGPYSPTVALGAGKVVGAGIGFPGIQLQLAGGPMAGHTVFYGHTSAVHVAAGQNVRAGQVVGRTGGPPEAGIDGGGHTEIGFMEGFSDQSGSWVGPGSKGGMMMHNLLHKMKPNWIHAAAQMASGGRVGHKSVVASWFGSGHGHSDPGTGHVGYRGDDLRGKMAYAELGMGSDLGGLPYGYPLKISFGGRSVIAKKLDIGAGGASGQKIDLWNDTAAALGFFNTGIGKVTIEDVGAGATSSLVAKWDDRTGGKVTHSQAYWDWMKKKYPHAFAHYHKSKVAKKSAKKAPRSASTPAGNRSGDTTYTDQAVTPQDFYNQFQYDEAKATAAGDVPGQSAALNARIAADTRRIGDEEALLDLYKRIQANHYMYGGQRQDRKYIDSSISQLEGDLSSLYGDLSTSKGSLTQLGASSAGAATGTSAADATAQQVAQLLQQLTDNQSKILAVTQTQGPALLAALAAVMNGDIGGRVGLGVQSVSTAGTLARL